MLKTEIGREQLDFVSDNLSANFKACKCVPKRASKELSKNVKVIRQHMGLKYIACWLHRKPPYMGYSLCITISQ